MRILTVNVSDLDGGAARAAWRLHQALLKKGVHSGSFVQKKLSDDHRIIGPQGQRAGIMARLRPSLDMRPVKGYPNYRRKMFSPAWFPNGPLVDRINASDADLVHLHWINGGMLSVEDIQEIRKPLVWSMHDMWTFTGGCHYDEECGRHATHCGSCPVLGSSREKDLSHRVFRRKQACFSKLSPITFVGLSRWMADLARSSPLLKGHEVVQLPNPIDTNTFKPVDKRMARELLGLPQDRSLVLFGAVNATADPRKGFELLQKSLLQIPWGDVELVIFGSSQPSDPPKLGHPMHYMGRMSDDITLCLLYNAADVTVVPSLQENLSNTIIESLSCGTPAVAFDIGGNPDMIVHGRNGFLATPFDPGDLAKGIMEVLQARGSGMHAQNAREDVLRKFSADVVADRYIALYSNVLARHAG
jgi:glycosyltransferase involved in cell wall biosynthesis